MTSTPVSPLRRRMIEDMSIRQYVAKTQHDYVRVVADFARFLGRSPDQAEPDDLRRYQLHLATQGAGPAKMNAAVSALRFFFKVTLGRPGFGDRLATVRREQRLHELAPGRKLAVGKARQASPEAAVPRDGPKVAPASIKWASRTAGWWADVGGLCRPQRCWLVDGDVALTGAYTGP